MLIKRLRFAAPPPRVAQLIVRRHHPEFAAQLVSGYRTCL
jgi:hypothetical protein